MKVNQNFIPTITIANITVPLNGGRYFTLFASTDGAKYDSFRNATGAKYQVPVGKSLRVLAINVRNQQGVGQSYYIGSSTASVSNSTIPAGYVAKTYYMELPVAGVGSEIERKLEIIIEATLYCNLYLNGGAGDATILCEEV